MNPSHQTHSDKAFAYHVTDQPAGLEPVQPGYGSSAPIPYHQENTALYPHEPSAKGEIAPEKPEEKRNLVFGLRPVTFWLIVIGLTIVLAAGIGGGVGGGLAAQRSNSNSPPATSAPSPTQSNTGSPSTSSSSTISAPSGLVSPAPTDGGCPSINSTISTPLDAQGNPMVASPGRNPQSFTRLCSTNYPSGAIYGNPGTADLLKFYAATLDDCIAACAAWNLAYPNSGLTDGSRGLCRSVALVKVPGEYCYLKNATGVNNTFGGGPEFVSAVLLPGSL